MRLGREGGRGMLREKRREEGVGRDVYRGCI